MAISETALKDALKDYIKQTDNPIQAAAVRYVQEMCKAQLPHRV
jgi:hypothetical protein